MNNDRIKIEVLRKEIEIKNNTIDSLLNQVEELKNKPKRKIGIGVK